MDPLPSVGGKAWVIIVVSVGIALGTASISTSKARGLLWIYAKSNACGPLECSHGWGAGRHRCSGSAMSQINNQQSQPSERLRESHVAGVPEKFPKRHCATVTGRGESFKPIDTWRDG